MTVYVHAMCQCLCGAIGICSAPYIAKSYFNMNVANRTIKNIIKDACVNGASLSSAVLCIKSFSVKRNVVDCIRQVNGGNTLELEIWIAGCFKTPGD